MNNVYDPFQVIQHESLNGTDLTFPIVDTEALSEPIVLAPGVASVRMDRFTGSVADPIAIRAIRLAVTEHRGVYTRGKRVFDVILAAVLIVLLCPIWLSAALAIRLSGGGHILYRQLRVGRNGRAFRCLKFQTMVPDAHAMQMELFAFNEVSGPVFKIKRDPRITPVGRWLRKFSIDEMPQLINVLRGEMSLVGPRPPLSEEVAHYTEHQLGRLAVPPGLTCLWQVSGRNHIGFDEWVELDLKYIERRCFWYDLWIIILTVPAVLTARGAF